MTRFQYLLGYAPTNATWDGKYRRVAVKVNRPGATVLYRRGYFATDQLVPLDRKSFVTQNRLLAAGQHDGTISDITVTIAPPVLSGKPPAQEALVEGTIQSQRIKFTEVDGRQVASLDLVVYCGDARETVIGETHKIVDLRLKDDTYEAFLKSGVAFSVRLTLSGIPRYAKVVVYDYGADVLGTTWRRIER